MKDGAINREAELRIAAMTPMWSNELVHRGDRYYALDRRRDLPHGRRYSYKLVGAD